MTDDEIIAEAQANFIKANRDIAEHCATGDVREIDGLLIKYTGVPADDQNAAFVVRPLLHPRETIATALAYFRARGLPYAVLVRDAFDPGAERACVELGLSHAHTLPAMALWPLPCESRPCRRNSTSVPSQRSPTTTCTSLPTPPGSKVRSITVAGSSPLRCFSAATPSSSRASCATSPSPPLRSSLTGRTAACTAWRRSPATAGEASAPR